MTRLLLLLLSGVLLCTACFCIAVLAATFYVSEETTSTGAVTEDVRAVVNMTETATPRVTATETPAPSLSITSRATQVATVLSSSPTLATEVPPTRTRSGAVTVLAGNYTLEIRRVWEVEEAVGTKPGGVAFLVFDVALVNNSSSEVCFRDDDFTAEVDGERLTPDNLREVRNEFFPERDYPGGWVGLCLDAGQRELSLLEYDIPARPSNITIHFTPEDNETEVALWLERERQGEYEYGVQSVSPLQAALVMTYTPSPNPSATFTPSRTPTRSDTPTAISTATATTTPEPTTSAPTDAVQSASDPEGTEAEVVRVIDGDTIEVDINGEIQRVRYIGVDTPERGNVCADEATGTNAELVFRHTVTLVKDVSETDRYGRLLRYVYVGDMFVNAELVRLGYAQPATFPPDVAYASFFTELAAEARAANVGCYGAAHSAPGQATGTPVRTTQTWYVNATSRVNIRSCASTSCAVLVAAQPGEAITVLSTADDWHEIQLADGRTGFIAAWLTSSTLPPVAPVAPAQPAPQQSVPQQPVAPQQPAAPVNPPAQPPPPAAPAFTCDCSKLCPAMSSCEEAYFQLNQCGCGRRDGDNDGVPCEEICPGG